MPLNSAPKFVVSTSSHNCMTTHASQQQHHNNNNNNNNNGGGGKLLICLRDLSKFRDQTLKSPISQHGSQQDRSKSSPNFKNSTTTPTDNSDCKPISIKREAIDSTSTHSPDHTSPQRFEPRSVSESDECGNISPQSEPPDEPKKGRDDAGVSPMGADDPLRDSDPAKQLSKLKRFLSTLQQFANDISKEIGDCVQTLIYWLVHTKISVEDFHQRLQQATNFPLRPFVVPFLKANLPLLQMELTQNGRYSPNGFILPSNPPKNWGSNVFPNFGLPTRHHNYFPPPLTELPPLLIPFSGALNLSNGHSFPGDLGRVEGERRSYSQRVADLNGNGKRMSPDRSPHSTTSLMTSSSSSSSSSLTSSSFSRPPFKKRRSTSPHATMMTSSSDSSTLSSIRSDLYKSKHLESSNEQRGDADKRVLEGSSLNCMLSSAWERFEERSNQIESLLLTLLNLADKCSQKMSSLKTQTRQDFERLTAHVISHVTDQRWMTSDDYVQKMDVKMKTEKVVNEVKQQALMEMQRAVAAAEAKASLTVANERMRMERVVEDARKQAKQEILELLNRQEESNENCWNCGRLASETCSGCNEARYCGLFCQHKDWECHHKVCRQTQERSGDHSKPLPPVPRNLLLPMESLPPPWSMVPNFLVGRNSYLVANKSQKSDKEGPMRSNPTVLAIKTERRDTPPATDVNSNVITNSAHKDKHSSSEIGDCNNRSSPSKEDRKKEKKKDEEEDDDDDDDDDDGGGKWTNVSS